MSDVAIRSPQGPAAGTYLNPFSMAAGLWRLRDLTWQFASRELLERHKGAMLGVIWNVLSPLLTLSVYTFVFGFVLNVRWENRGGHAWSDMDPHLSFALILFCGHSVAHLFTESVSRAPMIIASRPNLVRKVVFPLEILPVSVLGAGMVTLTVSLAILAVCLLAFAGKIPLTAPLVVVPLIPLIMLSLGVSWFLASLGVFLRDVRNVVQVVVHVIVFMSAVFYPIERVPEQWQPLVYYNPLAVIIENARRPLLWGELPQWDRLAWITLLAAVVMQAGYAWFMRTKRGMADVV
jgi:lipopolysaccharide transport system permease protein